MRPGQADQRRVRGEHVAQAHLGLREVEDREPAGPRQRDQRHHEPDRERGPDRGHEPAAAPGRRAPRRRRVLRRRRPSTPCVLADDVDIPAIVRARPVRTRLHRMPRNSGSALLPCARCPACWRAPCARTGGVPHDRPLDPSQPRIASRPGRRARSGSSTFAVLAVAFALPLRGLLRNQGPPMEEGFMLVFPERVLHGDFPNKDFLHLYGPGSLWVLAGWMKVLGVTLTSERLFALLQQIGVVGGVYWLARAWGRRLALCCALLSLLFIVPPLGLTALAWVGGVALGLLGLGLTLAGRRRLARDPALALRFAFFGGLVGAGALLFRLDLVVAVVLGALAATAGLGAAFKKRYALGLGIGLLAYIVQLATAGPYNTFKGMVLDPVVYLRGGRRLPIPPSWDHLDGFLQRSGAIQPPKWPLPHFSSSQQLFIWFFFMIVVVIALPIVGRIAVKRGTAAPPGPRAASRPGCSASA